MRNKDCNHPTFAVSLERLAAAGVFAEIHNDSGQLIFTDTTDMNFPLFTTEAVRSLCDQFGDIRTDDMLNEAAHIVRREMMAEKIRRAMAD